MALNRRNFVTSLAGAAAATAQPSASRKPNIIWIMADDLGYGDVGCYGQQIIRTPNIDRLATEGTRFTDVYAGCTVCAPSRSVLMTGRHTGHTTVRSNPGGVPILPEDVTVAEILKGAGYATGCFGKWGLGDIGTEGVPWKQGFDQFFGYLHQAHAHYYYPRFLYQNDKEFPLEGNGPGKQKTYSQDVIAEKSLEFLRQNKGRPFFACFAWTVPHGEYQVPEDSMAPYRAIVKEKGPLVNQGGRLATQPEPYAAFAGMVSRLDRDVGRVMVTLKELGLEENTIVFFTSDNGGTSQSIHRENYFRSSGPFRGHKQLMYEGGIRVPMIARWPGRIPAGRVSGFAWMSQDFLPTAAELAGVKPPAGIDGMSVLPTLFGRKQQPHEYLYWELPRYLGTRWSDKSGDFAKELPMQAVRHHQWKVVRPKPDAPLELYNLKSDPGETRDLAKEQPDVLARIEKWMRTARTEPRPQTEPEHPWWKTS